MALRLPFESLYVPAFEDLNHAWKPWFYGNTFSESTRGWGFQRAPDSGAPLSPAHGVVVACV